MLIRITAGPGLGQVIDALPAVARARIAGKTAVPYTGREPETAALEPGDRAAGLRRKPPKVEAPPSPPARGRGGRFQRQ